jgi:hypothetical protein
MVFSFKARGNVGNACITLNLYTQSRNYCLYLLEICYNNKVINYFMRIIYWAFLGFFKKSRLNIYNNKWRFSCGKKKEKTKDYSPWRFR